MSFPSAFPPSDIREIAEEQNEFYRATKADYIARGELLTLALFDCALEAAPGSFDQVKRLVNQYALGEIGVSAMHHDIMVICLAACGGSNWPLKVFRHEFYLLLGGLSTAQRDEAIFYHDTWRKNCMGSTQGASTRAEDIPLPQSEPTTPTATSVSTLEPPSIKVERANAIAARAAAPSGLVPSTEWDGQIHWGPYVAAVSSHFSEPAAQEAQAQEPEWVRRPCYNHYRWPSPLPRLVALEAGLTTNKRCKYTDAIGLLARRLNCTPEDFFEMSRSEVSERLFGKPHYWQRSTGVRKLLAQTSRYY